MKKSIRMDDFLLSFREIWTFDKRLLFIILSEVFINAILPFPSVLISGMIIDCIDSGKNYSRVIFYVILLFGISWILTVTNTLLGKSKEYRFIKFINKINKDINTKCMNMDYERFNDPSFQDRVMLINQMAHGNNYFTSITIVGEMISQFITLVGIILIISILNPWLLLIAFIVTVLQSILHIVRLRYARDYKSDVVHEQRKSAYMSHLAKDIETKKDVMMFDMCDFVLKKIESFQQSMLIYDKRRIKVNGFVEIVTYSLSAVFQTSAYILIGINAFVGRISVGDFAVGISSLIKFMSVISFLTNRILNYNDNIFYIRRYKSFQGMRSKYDAPSDIKIDDIDLGNIEIEFRNVSFRYPNSTNFVLRNVNLTIRNAERLAIVGYNGAGKTTFTLLLTRMYDPTEGTIYLNGIDIRRIDYRDYLKIFSTVNQDFSLLAFSILENVVKSDIATQEERETVTELFKNNGMGGRLEKLYRGLDTPITKVLDASGVDLSGGERQKIAIIRAIYKDAPILILDEPTASLDPNAEYEIYHKFSEMSKDKTTILVSHRISSTRFCNKIAVFDKGEIKEYGTYEDLMELKGLYYDFFQKQSEYF